MCMDYSDLWIRQLHWSVGKEFILKWIPRMGNLLDRGGKLIMLKFFKHHVQVVCIYWSLREVMEKIATMCGVGCDQHTINVCKIGSKNYHIDELLVVKIFFPLFILLETLPNNIMWRLFSYLIKPVCKNNLVLIFSLKNQTVNRIWCFNLLNIMVYIGWIQRKIKTSQWLSFIILILVIFHCPCI